jgi:hypothetical protein
LLEIKGNAICELNNTILLSFPTKSEQPIIKRGADLYWYEVSDIFHHDSCLRNLYLAFPVENAEAHLSCTHIQKPTIIRDKSKEADATLDACFNDIKTQHQLANKKQSQDLLAETC